MRVFKRYLADIDVECMVDNDSVVFSSSIKNELDSHKSSHGEELELYEVTFKPIKRGILTTTCTLKTTKEK